MVRSSSPGYEKCFRFNKSLKIILSRWACNDEFSDNFFPFYEENFFAGKHDSHAVCVSSSGRESNEMVCKFDLICVGVKLKLTNFISNACLYIFLYSRSLLWDVRIVMWYSGKIRIQISAIYGYKPSVPCLVSLSWIWQTQMRGPLVVALRYFKTKLIQEKRAFYVSKITTSQV